MKAGIIHIGGTPDKRSNANADVTAEEEVCGRMGAHCAGDANGRERANAPLPDEMRSLGYPRCGKLIGQRKRSY